MYSTYLQSTQLQSSTAALMHMVSLSSEMMCILIFVARVTLVSLGFRGTRAGQGTVGLWGQQDCQGELEGMEGRWDNIYT